MSLPAAKKDISDKPAKGSVIDPVDKKQKDADVDRKIRFYGVLAAFRSNKYPTNKQIDETLDYVLSHSPVSQDKLSPEGRTLIKDIQQIVETAREMVSAKNGDELIQNWLYSTRSDIDYDGHAAKLKDGATAAKDGAPAEEKRAEDGRQAIQHLRTLLQLVLTNSEVRKLLTDFGVIGRDLLSKGAAKAAETIAPSPEALANADQSAPQDEFRDRQEAEDILQGRLPGKKGEKQDEATEQAKIAKEDAKAEAKDAKADAKDVAASDSETKEKKSFMARVKGISVPPEHKEKVDAHKERAREFLTQEYFPKERRDQFIYRGKKVIIECQKHPDYQESLKWLLSFAEEYAAHGTKVFETGSANSNIASDPALKKSLIDIRTILERFANGRSMDRLWHSVDKLSEDAKKDEELREWFKQVDAYIRKVLLDVGYVIEPACETRGRELRESGRKFYDDKYRSHFDELFAAANEWFGEMGKDPINKKFGQDWARLTKDLLFDSEGSLKFKPGLWQDIRKVIVPELVDKVGYIPIPRIEYTDDSLDLVVENLTLSGRNLFPNSIAMEAHNYVKFSPYDAIKDEHHHEFKLTFSQVQADMRDVAFYFKKKTGMPKISDSGLADVVLGGEGVTATVHLASAPAADKTSLFHVKSCVVKIDSLKFSIRDSKHDLLYKTLKPLATNLVKKQIQKAIRDAVTTGLEYVDGQLVGVRDRMDEAKRRAEAQKSADGDSTTSEESRFRIMREAFKRPAKEASADGKASINSRNSQFKMVSNKRNSLLAQETGHPAGWVNRTQEREELAGKGEGWKTDAFDVVPTSKTVPTTSTATNGATTTK